VPGQNDDAQDLKGIAGFLASISPDLPWHVSRYHPDFEMRDPPATPVETLERAVEIGRGAGLRYVYGGNVGTMEDTVCPSCRTTVITRMGFSVVERNLRGAACGKCGAVLPLIIE